MGHSKEQFMDQREAESVKKEDKKESIMVVTQEVNENNSLFNDTKAQIQEKANSLVKMVENGNVSPITALIGLRKQMELLETAYAKIKDMVTETMPKGGSTQFSAKIETVSAGGKFDYSICGDLIWNKLNEKKEQIDKELKARQEVLKNSTPEDIFVDKETSESYQIKCLPQKVGGNENAIKITLL